MSCSNCFNNCTNITLDKCVKYTGVDISALSIENGDSLLIVENKIIEFLLTALNGTGIVPTIDPEIYCEVVSQYLPSEGDITIVHITTALIQAACNLQGQIDALDTELGTLEGDYDIDCLPLVDPASGTHAILQATITALCGLITDFEALSTSVSTNYVPLASLNTLIQQYLNSLASADLVSNKMVPYTAMEYYGPLTNFDASGAGIGLWANIYLCNGGNGTPDKRGRVGIGCTNMLGVAPLDAAVDPVNAGNPIYSLTSPGVSTKQGANTTTLTSAQIPSHSHNANSVVTDVGHFHYEFANSTSDGTLTNITYPTKEKLSGTNSEYNIQGVVTLATLGKSSTATTGITVATTNAATGSGGSHSNIQPVIACYYIIYLP